MKRSTRRSLKADKRTPSATNAKPDRKIVRNAKPVKRGNPVFNFVAGFVRLVWRIIWGTIWRIGLAVLAIVALATAFYYAQLPEASALFDGRARGSVTMMDRDGRVFAWRGETFGSVNSGQTASVLRSAVIAAEDKRFYTHLGISPRGIASAVKINLSEGRGPLQGHGGSTITQQVAKLLCLGEEFDPTLWEDETAYESECRRSSVWRKVKEVPFALALETKYSKDDILSIYMNRAYLGGGARGFEAAAQRYFGKSANDVGIAEAAMLAGLLKAPSYYAPTGDITRSHQRAEVILGLMADQGLISEAERTAAIANPAQLSRAAAARAGGYFADWVMEYGPAFLTTETTEDVTIRTTFDQRIQRAAERALAQTFAAKVKEGSTAEAAVVVMSADGAVRAMIGGRDKTGGGAFNRATQARRQTGSSFKPFVYAAALDLGYGPQDIVTDREMTFNIRGQAPYRPKNYTRRYYGDVTLDYALRKSLNAATIALQEAVGRDAVISVAQGLGISEELHTGPSLGLGVSESTLIEMTGAYAGIRNGGTSVRPYGLIDLRIKGDDTPLIGKSGGLGERVISTRAAAQLVGMMKGVIEDGTGGRAKLPGREAAGKTGTTQSARDAWFIGFTEQYIAGVWMGYDDNTPLTGVTGGGVPAEIWKAVMTEIHDGMPALPLTIEGPDGEGRYVVGRNGPEIIRDGDTDPLAAALERAMGQTGSPSRQDGSGATVPAPAAPPTPPTNDALGEALQNILRN